MTRLPKELQVQPLPPRNQPGRATTKKRQRQTYQLSLIASETPAFGGNLKLSSTNPITHAFATMSSKSPAF